MSQFNPGDRVQVVPSPCVDDPRLEGVTGTVIEPPPEVSIALSLLRLIAGPKPGHEDVVVQLAERHAVVVCSSALRRIDTAPPSWDALRAQLGYAPPGARSES